jgi:hypothetical protein
VQEGSEQVSAFPLREKNRVPLSFTQKLNIAIPHGNTGDCSMKNSRLWLIGGAAVVVIIAVIMTGMGSSVQSSRPGAGQGPQAGPGQGTGYSTGPGAGTPSLLPVADATPLTAAEESDILFMREEEQLAHDLYIRWGGMYTIPVFSTIAGSETMHISEVQLLIDRYGLQGNRIGNASAGYQNATIQSLYTTLVLQGDASLTGALEASLAVEERDIADLDHALGDTNRSDMIQVWSSLRQGSENHKSAFLRQLGR